MKFHNYNLLSMFHINFEIKKDNYFLINLNANLFRNYDEFININSKALKAKKYVKAFKDLLLMLNQVTNNFLFHGF